MPRSTVIGEAVARMLVGIGVVVTITGIAVAAPQASSSQNLFTPGVARALDATIARIIMQANLPSVAVLAAIPARSHGIRSRQAAGEANDLDQSDRVWNARRRSRFRPGNPVRPTFSPR